MPRQGLHFQTDGFAHAQLAGMVAAIIQGTYKDPDKITANNKT